MHHHETGGNYDETLNFNSEVADCKRFTHEQLGCLSTEVKQSVLPDAVITYAKTIADPERRKAVMSLAHHLLADNPNVFSSDANVLATTLPILLNPAEAAALNAEEARLDAENAALDTTLANDTETIAANEEGIAERKTMIVVLTNVTELEEMARTHEDFKDLRGRALLNALLADPSVAGNPELATRLGDIEAKLNGIASLGTEVEQATLNRYINTASLNLAADTDYGVFQDLVAKVENDDSISDATKAKVRAHFGVVDVETASDLQRFMMEGYGTDENGNSIAITEDKKAEVFPDTFVYEQPDGDRIFEVATPDGGALKIRFGETTSNQDLLERGFTAQVFGSLAQAGLADLIIGRSLDLQTGDVIDLHADEIVVAKRIASLMLGRDISATGRLLSSVEGLALGQKLKALQSDHRYDPTQRRTDLQILEIMSPDGQIDWQQFKRASDLINSAQAKGIAPNFDALKEALTGL